MNSLQNLYLTTVCLLMTGLISQEVMAQSIHQRIRETINGINHFCSVDGQLERRRGIVNHLNVAYDGIWKNLNRTINQNRASLNEKGIQIFQFELLPYASNVRGFKLPAKKTPYVYFLGASVPLIDEHSPKPPNLIIKPFGINVDLGSTGPKFDFDLDFVGQFLTHFGDGEINQYAMGGLYINAQFDLYVLGRARTGIIRINEYPKVQLSATNILSVTQTPTIQIEGLDLPGFNGDVLIGNFQWGLFDKLNTDIRLGLKRGALQDIANIQAKFIQEPLIPSEFPFLSNCFTVPGKIAAELNFVHDSRVDLLINTTRTTNLPFFDIKRTLYTNDVRLKQGLMLAKPQIEVDIHPLRVLDRLFKNESPAPAIVKNKTKAYDTSTLIFFGGGFGKLKYKEETRYYGVTRSCRGLFGLYYPCSWGWSPWATQKDIQLFDFNSLSKKV